MNEAEFRHILVLVRIALASSDTDAALEMVEATLAELESRSKEAVDNPSTTDAGGMG